MAGHGINHNAIANYDATEHVVGGVITRNTAGPVNIYTQDAGIGQMVLNIDGSVTFDGRIYCDGVVGSYFSSFSGAMQVAALGGQLSLIGQSVTLISAGTDLQLDYWDSFALYQNSIEVLTADSSKNIKAWNDVQVVGDITANNLSGTNTGDDADVVSFPTGIALPALDSGKYLTNNGSTLSWADVVLSDYLPLAGGVMTGNLTMDTADIIMDYGQRLYMDAAKDCWIGAEDAPDHIHFGIDGVDTFHMHTDCFQGIDACGIFISEGIIVDGGFDDTNLWTKQSYWTVAGSVATFNVNTYGAYTLTPNPALVVLANRDYIVQYDIVRAAGTASVGVQCYVGVGQGINNGPLGGTRTITEVINSGASTTGPYFRGSRASTGNVDMDIDNFTCRLLPENASEVGELIVHSDLYVNRDIVAPNANASFQTLAIAQSAFFGATGLPTPAFLTLVGGDNISYGPGGDGSSGVLTAGDGNNPAASGSGGAGGDFTFTTGDGGVHLASGSDGRGGDYTVILGAKGGATGSPLDGRFIIEDDVAADLFVVGKDGIGFWGVTPITQEVLATGASKVVDDVITALQNVGLVSQT